MTGNVNATSWHDSWERNYVNFRLGGVENVLNVRKQLGIKMTTNMSVMVHLGNMGAKNHAVVLEDAIPEVTLPAICNAAFGQ